MYCLNCHNDSVTDTNCNHCGIYLPTLIRDFLPAGTTLNGAYYTLGEAIGRGGFGVTYRASDRAAQPVAIKEYFPEAQAYRPAGQRNLHAFPEFESQYARGKDRFLREARILQGLNHPHIVTCLDLFSEHNTAYLVMPLLKGQSLARLMESPSFLTPDQVKSLIQPLVSALQTTHQSGVFHLDIKPDNIWVEESGNVLLLDFGAARQGATRKSTQAFTLEYAPPEILSEHSEVGAYSDIFELGMLVYLMLTGKKAPAVTERLSQMQIPLPELSDPWKGMLEQALHLNPQQRPQDIEKWWQQLEAPSPGKRQSRSRPPSLSRGRSDHVFGMSFVWLPPGRFYMGSPISEPGHQVDETLHRVELRFGFWLQTTPVTIAHWQSVMGKGSLEVGVSETMPITQVSWLEVQSFIEKLNHLGAEKYQLPTEAQWEYACRAGARRAYAFGNHVEQLQNYAWYLDNCHEIQAVGQLNPNLWGLYDMHGNVCEWCDDDFTSYGHHPRINPRVSKGSDKVYRGGSFQQGSFDCRSARRFQAPSDFKAPWLGFRLLRLSPEGHN